MTHYSGHYDSRTESRTHPQPEGEALWALADLSTEALVVAEWNGSIVAANEAAVELLGLSDRPADSSTAGEAGMPELLLYRESGGWTSLSLLARACAFERRFRRGYCVQCADGNRCPVELQVRPYDEATCLCAIRSIREQRRVERELQKQERVLALERKQQHMGHELNNRLTSVLGNLNLINASANVGDRERELAGRAESAVQELRILAGELLARSPGRLLPVDGTEVDLAQLVRYIADFSLRGRDVRSSVSGEVAALSVGMPADKLEHVVSALVTNAADAMPEGGVISILVSADEYGIAITFHDSGDGIATQDQERVFQPYFTTKPDALGLGLTVARDICRDYGGSISLTSRPGDGTSVTVRLPRVQSERQNPPRDVDFAHGPGFRILVMDDDESIRSVAREMLERLDIRVSTAVDGQEAVFLYRKALTTGQPYDAVLLDLSVPGALDGLGAMEQLRELDPNVVGILTSGYLSHPAMENYESFGFQAAIAKPYSMDQLVSVLSRVSSLRRE